MDRPELEKCLERLEAGDTLVVWRLDRLGRSLRDLLEIVNRLEKQGITFISLKKRFDTGKPAGRLIFHFFASFTQFERELIRERTRLLDLGFAETAGTGIVKGADMLFLCMRGFVKEAPLYTKNSKPR